MDKFDGSRAVSKKTTNILERPLNKGRNEAPTSVFDHLIHEDTLHYLGAYKLFCFTVLGDCAILSEQSNNCCRSANQAGLLQLYASEKVGKPSDTPLSDLGKNIGSRMLDVLVLREKGYKRETRIINVLLFVKTTVWKSLFGKEADKLEQSNDDDKTYYIIEKEPLVNKFISRQKDKGGLNCAYFISGIVEEILFGCNFHCHVTAHWHKGTTFMIQFDESVIARDKAFDAR